MQRMFKLQYQRKRKGLSQEDMAAKLSMSLPGYRKYEQGVRRLPIDVARKIVAILELHHIEDILEDAS